MKLPQQLTPVILTKAFMDLSQDRYPSGEKVLRLARTLGIDQSIELQIVIFGLLRDAVRQLSPRLYRSTQHRDELFKAIIEALETLEDQLEEREERELREEIEEAKRQDNRPSSPPAR